MAYGIILHFPGGTKAQYDTTLAAVHGTKDSFPEGQIFHASARQRVVGQSLRFTILRRVGSGAATVS